MALSVNPTLPVIAPQSVGSTTSGAVLVPGTVINAEVLKVADNLVQIAIAGLAMDVLSEVALNPGQNLQLAVSQTQDGGVRLSIVEQGTGAASATPADGAVIAPNAQAGATTNPAPVARTFDDPLTPLERVAVSVASEAAATRQQSLGPLFANLAEVVTSAGLPAALQQAVTQVLAQQTPLDPSLSGDNVQNAFQKSGLFLEASLAAPSAASANGIPDLKAALIVLRGALAALADTSPGRSAAAAMPIPAAQPGAAKPAGSAVASPPLIPGSPPDAEAPLIAPDVLAPPTRPQLAQDSASAPPQIVLTEALLNIEAGSATSATVLNLVQEALQEIPRAAGQAITTVTLPDGRNEAVTLRTLTPPPPFRGALPAAQPIAAATIPHDAPLATITHRLLDDIDAALARQTLLQVASLPGGSDPSDPRIDPGAPRWNFEIPFATPQGTAMAQFAISRDGGGGNEVEAGKRVWRARFTLDIEPAGPVHALVSLSGERTSVRMWAERPQTAARLRAGASELSQALVRAELSPGDIVIREGTPPQAAPARAGHFLDRAL